jgi:hypothetical protein
MRYCLRRKPTRGVVSAATRETRRSRALRRLALGCAIASFCCELSRFAARIVCAGRLAIFGARRVRRDGRVAEGARLESVYTGNRIVGSNPTPSAMSLFVGIRLSTLASINLM